eukprot:m.1136973 g.1136973  ORF g.1136973 m.1136973 type:complete len:141 (-) comp24433_c0_seq18:2537-2959(-)
MACRVVSRVSFTSAISATRVFGGGVARFDQFSDKVCAGGCALQPGKRILCRHPFIESKRAYVVPAKIEKLHHLFWDRGVVCRALPDLDTLRQRARASVLCQRPDHIRALNPTPYKVSVTEELYSRLHRLWLTNAPVTELS